MEVLVGFHFPRLSFAGSPKAGLVAFQTPLMTLWPFLAAPDQGARIHERCDGVHRTPFQMRLGKLDAAACVHEMMPNLDAARRSLSTDGRKRERDESRHVSSVASKFK